MCVRDFDGERIVLSDEAKEAGLVGNVKLFMFPGSDAAVSASLMLKYKGVPHKEVWLPPGVHGFILLMLGFQSMGVPALTIGSRRVQGSRWIARALDEIVTDPPLFPDDPDRRKAVEEAERWGELFNDAMRRLFYCAARRDLSVFTTAMTVGRGRGMRIALRLSAPLIVRLAGGAHHASDSAGREDLALLADRLIRIDRWIEQGVLNGETLNAADFQIAPAVATVLRSEDLWAHAEGRPAAALARRVLPDWGGSQLQLAPAEWLVSHGSTTPGACLRLTDGRARRGG